jgi:hypothetical protein
MPTKAVTMPARGLPTSGDPLLSGADWRAIKTYWRRRRLPCARCGHPINYDRPQRGPDSLDVGHIIDRDQAKALGWTRKQINSITNTQPECQRCSRSAGATLGNTKRGDTRRRPLEVHDW